MLPKLTDPRWNALLNFAKGGGGGGGGGREHALEYKGSPQTLDLKFFSAN